MRTSAHGRVDNLTHVGVRHDNRRNPPIGLRQRLGITCGDPGALHAYRSFMTQPRLVVPGDTLMITRRTLRRHHLFRPDSAIRQLYLYTLASCAQQFGILVHAVTLMSTHEHLIVTDPQGRYPDFLRRLHRLVSLGASRPWLAAGLFPSPFPSDLQRGVRRRFGAARQPG